MNILDPRDKLREEFTGLAFFDSGILDDVVEELSSVRIFHDQIKLLMSLDDFIELNDARMSHEFENVNLAGHTLDISYIFDSIFF